MARQAMTDGSGRWFDTDKAETFEEDSYHDGSNHISKATGSQWHHEILYRTASGVWVKHWWSQHQGAAQTYEVITEDEARAWLAAQDHHDAIDTSSLEL